MPFVIRHPARVDLFVTGEGEWGPLSQARHFASDVLAGYFTEPGGVVLPSPEKQPTHPLSHTNP